jgi:ASCH domain
VTPDDAVPALSLWQPWPELILAGRKTVELRSWDTPYRGPLWLHAGKHEDVELEARFGIVSPPKGAFVGRVELVEITPLDADRWRLWRPRHLADGPYEPGWFGWTLESPERLRRPVAAPGRQKLFRVEPELVERLVASLPS